MASASYREPRPHARSAAARQEKTRGRRRISRKAPDPSHDAVRTGAESDGRLHTGTTYAERSQRPHMGKGQLGPFAQSSPPGSHWGIRGTVSDLERVGGSWLQGVTGWGPGTEPSTVRDHFFHTGKMTSSLTTSPDEPADHARAGSSCRPWPDQGEGCRMGCGRAWTAFGPGRETSLSFRPHSQPGSLQAGVKSEIPVLLRDSLKTHPRPQRSSPCLIRPPSRCAACLRSFPPSEPPALVSLVRACGGASFAPTPRLLGASLPLRRYVRRVGVGTWPRGAVFPAFPVVHVLKLPKDNLCVKNKLSKDN